MECCPLDINGRNYALVQHIAVTQAIEVGSHSIAAGVYPVMYVKTEPGTSMMLKVPSLNTNP